MQKKRKEEIHDLVWSNHSYNNRNSRIASGHVVEAGPSADSDHFRGEYATAFATFILSQADILEDRLKKASLLTILTCKVLAS